MLPVMLIYITRLKILKVFKIVQLLIFYKNAGVVAHTLNHIDDQVIEGNIALNRYEIKFYNKYLCVLF